MKTIEAAPLTPEAFSSFGQVLAGRGKGPERHGFAARIENRRSHAEGNMTFMRVAVTERPFRIQSLERHLYSNQSFIPLNGTRQLVVVCPSMDHGEPDLERVVAFTAEGDQAVNYNAAIWHAPRMAISEPGELIMFRWDDGSEADTELRALESPIGVLV